MFATRLMRSAFALLSALVGVGALIAILTLNTPSLVYILFPVGSMFALTCISNCPSVRARPIPRYVVSSEDGWR